MVVFPRRKDAEKELRLDLAAAIDQASKCHLTQALVHLAVASWTLSAVPEPQYTELTNRTSDTIDKLTEILIDKCRCTVVLD